MRKVLPFVACLAACEGGSSGGTTIGAEQNTQLPPIKVNLPPPPSFTKPATPEKYPDNTWSVYGVRRRMADNLDQTVRVKAYLIEYYQCPCPEGKTTDTCTCELPHFWLGDDATTQKDKALLVADMPYNDLGKKLDLKVEQGKQYIVEGVFARQSNTGFAASDGLVIYKAHGPGDGSAPVAPPDIRTK